MLQRTLAPLLLLTLLLSQALTAVCDLRCAHTGASSHPPTCHAMSMPDIAPGDKASSCPTHPCPTADTLLVGNAHLEDLSSPPAEAPESLLPASIQALNRPLTAATTEPPAPPPPLPAKTALRV